MPHLPKAGARPVWPWDEQPSRGTWFGDLSWLLPVATALVLAAGYAWLGETVAGAAGALVGCLVGLVVSGLLHVLVDRTVSGRRPARGPSSPRRN
ncbi:hypothetical protein ACFCXS_33060 [Streptomyces sp. NPDC056373]|uniref:hypothetical protein n=1 Tax=Streptomyces sp. NPDC056373 TaxID=3345798 RepID=UPI0035DFE5A6